MKFAASWGGAVMWWLLTGMQGFTDEDEGKERGEMVWISPWKVRRGTAGGRTHSFHWKGKASDYRDFKRLKELELQDREESKSSQVFPAFQGYGTCFLPSPGSQEVSGVPDQIRLWCEVTHLITPQLGHGGGSKSRRWRQWHKEHQTWWHWVWWTNSHHRGETGVRRKF